MRVLTFRNTSEDRDLFTMLYTAFLSGGPQGGGGSKTLTLLHGKILERFFEVSREEVAIVDGKEQKLVSRRTGDPIRVLSFEKDDSEDAELVLELEDAEFEKVKEYAENFSWSPGQSIIAGKIFKLLDDAPEKRKQAEPAEAKKPAKPKAKGGSTRRPARSV